MANYFSKSGADYFKEPVTEPRAKTSLVRASTSSQFVSRNDGTQLSAVSQLKQPEIYRKVTTKVVTRRYALRKD